MPELVVELISAWEQGKTSIALDIHDRICDLADAMFIEGNPVPVKAALAMRGRMLETVRSPLAQLSEESARYVREVLASN